MRPQLRCTVGQLRSRMRGLRSVARFLNGRRGLEQPRTQPRPGRPLLSQPTSPPQDRRCLMPVPGSLRPRVGRLQPLLAQVSEPLALSIEPQAEARGSGVFQPAQRCAAQQPQPGRRRPGIGLRRKGQEQLLVGGRLGAQQRRAGRTEVKSGGPEFAQFNPQVGEGGAAGPEQVSHHLTVLRLSFEGQIRDQGSGLQRKSQGQASHADVDVSQKMNGQHAVLPVRGRSAERWTGRSGQECCQKARRSKMPFPARQRLVWSSAPYRADAASEGGAARGLTPESWECSEDPVRACPLSDVMASLKLDFRCERLPEPGGMNGA